MKVVRTNYAQPFGYILEHKAKKEHKCACCEHVINVGDMYFNKKWMSPSRKFFSVAYCTPCFNKKNVG